MRSGLNRHLFQTLLMLVEPFDSAENLIGLRQNSIFEQHDIALDLPNVAFDLPDVAFNTTKARLMTE